MSVHASMPLKLKEHLKNLEFEVIQHTSWKVGSKVVKSIQEMQKTTVEPRY